MKKVLITFSKLRDSDFFTKSRVVYQGMNGNEYFPSPDPVMAVFLAKIDEFEAAITVAKTGDRNAIATKNALRFMLNDFMRNLAMYVNAISRGDVVKLVSSGFTLAKDRQPVHIGVPIIRDLVQWLHPGSIQMRVEHQAGVKVLLYQVAPDPITETTEWVILGDSRLRFVFSNLEQGKKYWFRVAAVGSNGQMVYSEEVAQYVMKRTLSKVV